MDLADMEEKIVSNCFHVMILCPHTSTGRVWERQELEALMEHTSF